MFHRIGFDNCVGRTLRKTLSNTFVGVTDSPVPSRGNFVFMGEKNKLSYQDLLRHPKWQKKRLQILERDDFTCQYCGDKETELQIHHLKYYKNPWDAKDEHLLTLCKDCHHLTTFNKGLNVIAVSKQKFGPEEFLLFVKHKPKEVVVIEIVSRSESGYMHVFTFKHNGTIINNLIKLNNG